MTNTQDVKTLLGSLLRVNQAEAANAVDHSIPPQSELNDDDSPLSQSELYRDEQGRLLPSKLHVVPLFGRPVMPSQITTVQLNLEWIDVITEVIASPHHTFAMFAVSEDKLKQRKISLKDFPKTGTVVRLLSARTGPDEIDIICEGLRRVSLLDVADIRMNLAKVRYPEIEYRLANPTLHDKLNSNAQALRQSLERTSEFEKAFKKLRLEFEQYARSVGVRVGFSPLNFDPEFFLICNKHQVGRISLGKLNTMLDFIDVKLTDEQKLKLAAYLARPNQDEYVRLKKYASQLHDMAQHHHDAIGKDLERLSPKTKALADSLMEMINQQRQAQQNSTQSDKNTNAAKDAFIAPKDNPNQDASVVEAVIAQDSSKGQADSKLTAKGEQVELPASSQELGTTEVSSKTNAVDKSQQATATETLSLGPIYMSADASLDETIAAAMQKLAASAVKNVEQPSQKVESAAETELKSAYKSRLNQEASSSLNELMLPKLKLSDADYSSSNPTEPADTDFNLNEVLNQISQLIQTTSDDSLEHSKNFKLTSMGSSIVDVSGDPNKLMDELLGSKSAKVNSDVGIAKTQADTALTEDKHEAHAVDKKDLFELFSLLNEVGRREEIELKNEQEQFKQQTIENIIKSTPKDDDSDSSPVLGPNFGFVNEDTSVVTFMPGQDSSEDLLLKLTNLQKEQEQKLKEEAAAARASKAAQDALDAVKSMKKGKAGVKDKNALDDSSSSISSTLGADDKSSLDDTVTVIDTSSSPDEVSAEIIASDEVSEKDIAKELSGLFSLLGDEQTNDNPLHSKWSSLQRAALIRTKIAELLGGKVVFGVSTLNEKQKGAQREVESRAYCLGITSALQELLPLNPLITEEMQQYLSRSDMSNPSVLADCAASITQSKPQELQKVLDTIPILPRLKLAFELISRELSAAKLQDKIKMSVAEKIQKRQKEFFLKEQLNEIKTELGLTADEKDLDVQKFRDRMKKLSPPAHIKERFEEELGKLSVLEPASPEYGVTRNYLDIMSSIPWGKMSKEKFNLDRARKILDQDHEGLQDVKDRIIEFMAVGSLKGQTRGQIMLFVGPPGVGKTSIGKSIAKALNRPFFRLSLGGIDDVSEIKGHRKTYVGAMPGKLVNALRETKVMNPVIMLDEIDKLGRSYHGDPDSALLETLDPEQNKNFLDVYLDEKLDLSNCLFICTANSTETISGPLLDRMDPIQLSGYIAKEKFAIAKKHLIPRAFDEAGIKDKRTLQIPDVTLNTLIEGYARESGVRSLERAIAKLIRKAAVKLVEGTSRITIKPEDLEDYLGTAPFKKEKMLQGVGIMTGLAWTASGGVTLPVESIVTSQEAAGFKLTGSLGDVMKESASIALSFVQSHLGMYAPKKGEQFFKKKMVHLHVPEGAIPKDGPSAGVTMATSLLSLALNQPPKKGFAMTGELTLTGHVLPIGGLREKVIAARRMGIFDLIIPIGNEGDVKELPEQVKTDVTFYYADTYSDVAYVLFDDVKQRLDEQGYEAPRSYKFEPQAKEPEQNKEQAKSQQSTQAKVKTTKAKPSATSERTSKTKPSDKAESATKAKSKTAKPTKQVKTAAKSAFNKISAQDKTAVTSKDAPKAQAKVDATVKTTSRSKAQAKTKAVDTHTAKVEKPEALTKDEALVQTEKEQAPFKSKNTAQSKTKTAAKRTLTQTKSTTKKAQGKSAATQPQLIKDADLPQNLTEDKQSNSEKSDAQDKQTVTKKSSARGKSGTAKKTSNSSQDKSDAASTPARNKRSKKE